MGEKGGTFYSPWHQASNFSPSAFSDEEANDGIREGTPGLADEEDHGGLERVYLQVTEGRSPTPRGSH